MAVLARHLSLRQRHVRALAEVDALLAVASEAGFRNAGSLQQACRGKARHRVVAVAAGEIDLVVHRAMPVDALAAFMARQALTILDRDRRAPLAREADDPVAIGRVGDVLAARTMTGLADLLLLGVARIEAEHPRMRRIPEVLVLERMAGDADFLAHGRRGAGRLGGGMGRRGGCVSRVRDAGSQPCREAERCESANARSGWHRPSAT